MPARPHPTPNTPQAQTILDAYAALNHGDAAGFAACLHPEIVRVEPAGFPMSGTYTGLAALTAHLTAARATWAQGMGHAGTTDASGNPTGCLPHRVLTNGNRVVAIIDVNVRLANEPGFRTGRLADVFTFQDGKATEFRTFADAAEALAYAGIDPAQAEPT